MMKKVSCFFLVGLLALACATEDFEYPDYIFNEEGADYLDLPHDIKNARHVSHAVDHDDADVNWRFDVPFDFADMELMALQTSEQTVEEDEDSPIQCETICRPLKEINQTDEGSAASFLETSSSVASVPTDLAQKLCEAKGGAWNEVKNGCDQFMQATTIAVEFAAQGGEGLYAACSIEHGDKYLPCNPYQALALAHLYNVPDHQYYWLWPGGNARQVREGTVFKRDIGENPTNDAMTKCPQDQHVGFFHNWDKDHVDSWGCLHVRMKNPVLCCRRA